MFFQQFVGINALVSRCWSRHGEGRANHATDILFTNLVRDHGIEPQYAAYNVWHTQCYPGKPVHSGSAEDMS